MPESLPGKKRYPSLNLSHLSSFAKWPAALTPRYNWLELTMEPLNKGHFGRLSRRVLYWRFYCSLLCSDLFSDTDLQIREKCGERWEGSHTPRQGKDDEMSVWEEGCGCREIC